MSNRRLRLGVVSLKNLDSIRYLSCIMLNKYVLRIVRERFKPRYFWVDNCHSLNRQKQAFNKFVSSCDLIFDLQTNWVYELKDKSIPIIFFAYGSVTNPFNFVREFWHRLWTNNAILFSSNADLEIFNNIFGKTASKMAYLLPWPLDMNEFRPQSAQENKRIRERFGIPIDCPLLLYAGRINRQKNIHTLLKIFKEVVKIIPASRLCIVGSEDRLAFRALGVKNKGYARYLKKKCLEYGILDKVVMTGHLDKNELIPLYSSADIFINCTINPHENFGYAQVEAMACGIPVICSDWGGLRDTVIHERTGYLMPTILTQNGIKVDWQKGVSAIVALLRDKKKLTKLSGNCIEHVNKNFSLDRFAHKLETVFLDTLKRKCQNLPIQNLTEIKKQDHSFMNLFMEYLYSDIKAGGNHNNGNRQNFFQRNYNFCKSFITAYSSAFASEISPEDTRLIPYFLQDVSFNGQPAGVIVHDPAWPRKYRLKNWEFRTLALVDGNKSIRDIYSHLRQNHSPVKFASLMRLFKRFTDEGVLSFLTMKTN